jgi:tRNA G10  N-methylase Trm11
MEEQRPTREDITRESDSKANSEMAQLAQRVSAHLKMEETYLQERQEVLAVKKRHFLGERLHALRRSVFEKAKAKLPGRKPKS